MSDKYISFCSSGSFATGVTVWSFSVYVYGIMLECAYATATCLPPNYPTSLLTGASPDFLNSHVRAAAAAVSIRTFAGRS